MNTWTRKGECNRCGWCCQYEIAVRIKVNISRDPDYYKVRGHQLFADGTARSLAYIGYPCPKFDEKEKSCMIYSERPRTCIEFPNSPDQVEDVPCSYWFERVGSDGSVERRGGMESPWPTSELYP